MAFSNDVLSITSNVFDARWNVGVEVGTPVFVTFSFGDSRAAYDTQHPNGFTLWTEQAKSYIRQAFQIWDRASGIHFIEVPDSAGGQIRVSLYDMTGTLNSVGQQASGFGYYPSYRTSSGVGIEPSYNNLGGDLFLNSNFFADPTTFAPGQSGFSVALHEIGHTIGFKHPFEGTPVIDPAHDNANYTVMSYTRSGPSTVLGSVDIEASQIYYGKADLSYNWDPTSLTLSIFGSSANEILLGTNLADVISAGGGNDIIRGGPGNDTIDGGEGLDTSLYGRNRTSYSIAPTSSGIIVTDSSGTDGSDALVNVERLQFLDLVLALDTQGNAGNAYRLYQAAFNRTPDQAGLSFWTHQLDFGVDIQTVAAGFVNAAEFKAVYGVNPTHSHIVDLMYQNVLGRAGEPAGISFWVGQLDRGLSIGALLEGFAVSSENHGIVDPKIAQGIVLDHTAFLV